MDSLKQLKPKKDNIYTHITSHFLANPEFLKLAYSLLKNKEDNLTPGGNNSKTTLDGISRTWFDDTALRLRKGTYQFSPSRRISISKKDSLTPRSLTVGNPKDKIIQKAIQLVLEEIYENKEKTFSDASHGFRSDKSFHTALEKIKHK